MSLLDRLRGQPNWQHDDPEIRALAVYDLESDAQDLLTAIATEDTDSSVRLAAVSRLVDPALIARVATHDAADEVRREASAMLRAIAVDADDDGTAREALSGLTEVRDLGEVARVAKLESVSQSALERLQSAKAIGAVARRSTHRLVRDAALARLDDRDELLAVAVKSDYRDVALAAFERLAADGADDSEMLKTIAVRARTKPVARRARLVLASLDAQPVAPSSVELRGRRDALCDRVKELLGRQSWKDVNRSLEEAERDWHAVDELETDVAVTPPAPARNDDADAERDPADTVVRERWTHAVAAVREHLIQLDIARSEAKRQRQIRDEVYDSKVALCERLAALVAEEGNAVERITVEVETIRAAWDASADASADDDAGSAERSSEVTRRFQELIAATEHQVVRRATAAERVAKLGELATLLEQLSEAKDVSERRGGWTSAHREWITLSGESTPSELSELRPRVEAAETRRAERMQTAREERTRRERANLTKQESRCEEIEQALADEELELKTAEHWTRLTRSLLGNLGRLPSPEDRERITARLRTAQTGLNGRARELRGLAEWKQWANVGIQAALCQRLETAAAHPKTEAGDAALVKEFRQIMNEWRQAADVPRGEGDEIWKRFKTAHDALRPRVEAHQAKQGGLQQEHLEKKITLCDKVEQLADSTDWVKTAQRITELQQEWKQIGSAGRKYEREVWNRFRAASGRFFKRRRDDLVERKQVWAKNAALKEEFCVKAEALSEEQDFDKAKGVVRQLQTEWKQIGPVRRSRSETLWQRFRTACDDVYRRAQAEVDASFVEQITARAAVCERLEALVSEVAPAGPPAESAESKDAEGVVESVDSAAAVGAGTSGETDESVEASTPPEPGSDADAELTPPADLTETIMAARDEWRQLPPVPRVQERSLTARFETAVTRVVEGFPEAFAGTDLDPARHQAALERLCERVESFVKEDGKVAGDGRSPTEVLALQLKEALASNTMGAGVDPEAKRLETIETVKRLQSERRALGRVLGEAGQRLSDRFRAACDRFFAHNPVPPARAARPRGDESRRRRRGGSPVSH